MKNTSHTTYKLFPIFLFSLLLFPACTSDEIPEPIEPTFPYFHMEVDGELWEPSGVSIGGGTLFSITYREDLDGFISLSALSDHEDIENFNLGAKNCYLSVPVFEAKGFSILDQSKQGQCIRFELDSLNTLVNLQIIDLNWDNRTIKVEFELDCFNQCGEIRRVRKGQAYTTISL